MSETCLLRKIKAIVFHFLNPKQDKVFIFGSRALGTAGKFSDVDIGIESQRHIDEALLSEMKEQFEDSDLPYKVEVIDFSTVSDRFRQVAMKKAIYLNK